MTGERAAPAPSARCTPSRSSASRAWTATRRWRSSSGGSGRLPGLEALRADVLSQRLRVTYDAARLSAADVAEAVASTGMRAWLEHEQPVAASTGSAAQRGSRWSRCPAPLSAPALAAALRRRRPRRGSFAALRASRSPPAASTRRGGRWSAARALALDINVLMLVAVAGAVAIGEWSEAAAVVFLFALAQSLETRSMERARHAIRALMDLAPAEGARAARRRGAARRAWTTWPSATRSSSRPGEKIPLDGVVVDGRERREPGADHRRVAAGRQGARATRCSPARSTATARSTSG